MWEMEAPSDGLLTEHSVLDQESPSNEIKPFAQILFAHEKIGGQCLQMCKFKQSPTSLNHYGSISVGTDKW